MYRFKPHFSIDDKNFRIISYSLIIIGIAIRLYHYFFNRSLWLDEAMLSNNIISKNWIELLYPLDNRQIAPIGFIFVQKSMISLFGANELALRLFPLLTGIASIIIFYLLLKKIAGEKFAAAGIAIFILGKYLIFHATEAKQYGMDAFVYIVAFYYLYFNPADFKNRGSIVVKGIIGAILIWFSHCSIFILTGIACGLAFEIIRNKNYKDIPGFTAMGSVWLVSFIVNYYLFLHDHSSRSIQETAFLSEGYLPPHGSITGFIHWLLPMLKLSLVYPIAVNMSALYLAILFAAGLLYTFIFKEYKLFILGIPVLIHIALSILNLYPFGGRFNLYMGAMIVIFIVLGLKLIATGLKFAGTPVVILLLLGLIIYPAKRVFKPFNFEEIKPSLFYIQEHKSPDDVLYVHAASLPAFDFYRDRYSVGSKIIRGSFGIEAEINALINLERVWILMTHYDESEKNIILDSCKKNGRVIDEFEYGGGYTLLCNFNSQKDPLVIISP